MYYHRTVWNKNVVQKVHLVWCVSMCITQKLVTEGIRTAGSRRKAAEDIAGHRTWWGVRQERNYSKLVFPYVLSTVLLL